MSAGYVPVSWNRHKRVYDAAAGAFALLFVGTYVVASKTVFAGSQSLSDEVLLIRALGSCAIVLLHVILCIGPGARLWPTLAPLLYNRRHLGVMTFLIALCHGVLAIGYYHGFGNLNPLVSLFQTSLHIESMRTLPYQLFGFAGLGIMFLMAATSHDFWLNNLSALVWKRLHMMIYVAYPLLIAHVAFGALQAGHDAAPAAFLSVGAGLVCTLHLVSGWRERSRDRRRSDPVEGWIDGGDPSTIPDGRARMICSGRGERLALFRKGDQLFATTNLCAHQGGPLSEGRIIGGCITCPWHGWQYRPEDGCSPPPFKERVAIHQVRVVAGRALVNPTPSPSPVGPGGHPRLRS